MASGANASMDASLMNDSVSLASLNESMSVGTLDDSDDESDAEKASRNVKKFSAHMLRHKHRYRRKIK